MPKDLPPEAPADGLEDDGYGPPSDLDDAPPPRPRRRASSEPAPDRQGEDGQQGDDEGPDVPAPSAAEPPPPQHRGLKIGLALAAAALVAAALLGYRSHQRSRALAEGLPKAEASLRLDTAAGYREAADLLVPLAKLDPLEAGSMRAFALAMLACDYRDADAASRAEALLLEPSRADVVPPYANLASAALFLGRRAVADAATYAGRAGRHPAAGALQGRIAFLAGNLEAAVEPLADAASEPRRAAALSLQGDLARRLGRDPVAARAAYAAALDASPLHPRAAYGMAKLALASQVPLAEALAPLRRLVADAQTPVNERARAALHLASLELERGDRAAAATALGTVPGLEGRARHWAEQAAVAMAGDRKGYRAVLDAQAPFLSASDDDPPELSPLPPPPEPAPVVEPAKAPPAKAARAAKAGKPGKTVKAASPAKATGKATTKKAPPPKKAAPAAKAAPPPKKGAAPAKKPPTR